MASEHLLCLRSLLCLHPGSLSPPLTPTHPSVTITLADEGQGAGTQISDAHPGTLGNIDAGALGSLMELDVEPGLRNSR